MSDRNCNNCVYATRDGNCNAWECNGNVTIEDIKAETRAEAIAKLRPARVTIKGTDYRYSEYVEFKKIERILK